jgi:tetrapyrrole methylase family protein / MazG family protein
VTPQVLVCGLGPGGRGQVTEETRQAIVDVRRGARYVRTERHPTADLVVGARSFDHHYEAFETFDEVYRAIAEDLVTAALAEGVVLYAVPGSPLVLERSVAHLRRDPRVEVRVLPALSFLDLAWARLGIDPVEAGVRLVDGHEFSRAAAGERGPLLVAHTHANWVLSDIKLALDAGDEQRAVILQRLGTPDEHVVEVGWPELDRTVDADHLTCLYLPELAAPVGRELLAAVDLVRALRQQCPWDREQTHASLKRYLLEEAYEVLEAVDQVEADPEAGYPALEEELGDLLFQVLFHSELAAEAGEFTVADVARTVHDKLVGRHPHVFGDVVASDAAAVLANWEQIKKAEKGRESVMDGIPSALPALAHAEKVLKKAARTGVEAPAAEVSHSLARALDGEFDADMLGTSLLALVDLARRAGLDPEDALRARTEQFRQGFRTAELSGTPMAHWVAG